jgi:hypothetical protein
MNKTVIRIGAVVVVILLIVLYIFGTRSPFGKNNSSFGSEPRKEITRVEFSDGIKKLSLEKVNTNWLINGKDETRKNAIVFILRVLTEIKIKSPVTSELFKTEITGKNVIPVKVKVYEKRRLLKSFLVYRTTSNIYGNVMKMKEQSKPFIVYVPGYDGDIGSAFTLNELFWQPFTVFSILPSEIASVDFENFSDTTASFFLTGRNRHFALSDRYNNLSGWDSTLIIRYLSYFIRVPFESWAFDISNEEKRRIEDQLPAYRITVTENGGIRTVLTLWAKLTGEKGSVTTDNDRMYGKTGKRDELFIIRYFDIDPLLKKKSYFFPQ